MKKFLFLLVSLFVFISCAEDTNEKTYDNLQLRSQLNGRYKLISSEAQDAIDLNGDGVFSKKLMDENPMISLSAVQLIVPVKEVIGLKSNEFIYDEIFPTENEQRLKIKGAVSLEKGVYEPYYDLYGNTLKGTLNKGLKASVSLEKPKNDKKNTLIGVESVEFLSDTIKVKEARKFFTSKGWVKTKIESIYKKYTDAN